MIHLSEEAANKIIQDIESRAGLGDEWGMLDEDIQEEIKTVWSDIIFDAMSDWGHSL